MKQTGVWPSCAEWSAWHVGGLGAKEAGGCPNNAWGDNLHSFAQMFGGIFGGDKKDKSKEKPLCSSHDYIAEKLHKIDAENYAAAGILVYNPIGPERFEVLLGRSSSKHEIEFLGGKRDAEEDVWMTAAREFDEETSGVLGEIKKDLSQRTTLIKACKESSVLWYSRGRYALFLVPASKLHNLVIFDKPGDSLPSRHKAFLQSGKAKGKSSSYQEM